MIGIFLGDQNSGKTLSMTYYALRYFKNGFKVYSNYNLNFRHEKLNKDVLINFVTGKVQFNKAIFCIDEIYLLLDARSFGKKASKLISYLLLQTSKRNVHVFGSAQRFNTVEKRFRENTSFMCFCERVMKNPKDKLFYHIPSKLRILPDTSQLYIKNNFMIRDSDGIHDEFRGKTYYLKAQPMFKEYNTRELLGVDV